MPISISEIFGPTIQGEGYHIGYPTIFVRTGGCDYKCRWCLHSNTIINKIDGVSDKIKNIKVDDKLIGYDENTNTLQPTTVVATASRTDVNLWSLITKPENGVSAKSVVCSNDHMFMTTQGWKATRDIKIGDIILSTNDMNISSWQMTGDKNPMKNPVISKQVAISLKEYWADPDVRDRQRNRQKALSCHSENMMGDKNPMKNPDNVARQIESRSDWKPSSIELRVQELCEYYSLPYHLCIMDTRVNNKYPDFIIPEAKKAVEVYDPTFLDYKRPILGTNNFYSRGETDYCERTIKSYNDAGWKILMLPVNSNESNSDIIKKLTIFMLNGRIVISCKELSTKAHGALKGDFIVHDIKCEPYPTFFANGLLTHNCDTLYAVDPEYLDSWTMMSDEEIMFHIKDLSKNVPMLVTFSGGNPAIWDLSGLMKLGHTEGYTFTMETQGSIPRKWFDDLDFITISPKPPSSGMITNWDKLSESIDAINDPSKVSIKVVVSDEDDYHYAIEVFDKYPEYSKYITPCNMTPGKPDFDSMFEKMRWVMNKLMNDCRYDITILPQLHVLLWGNKRGK